EDAHPFPEALQARAFGAADLDAGLPSDTTGEPATYEGIVSAEDMDWSSSGSGFDGALHADPELAELLASAAGLEADQRPVDSDPAPEPAETPDPLSLGDGLSLADDDAPIQARSQPRDAIDLDALSSRLDGLSLADPDSYGHGALRGAVLVEAGLGGPDAVRQLLGGLDDSFPRPVLVRLQLDGGRYERLVQQMQRATPMPVALAAPGGVAEPGTAWFLPP